MRPRVFRYVHRGWFFFWLLLALVTGYSAGKYTEGQMYKKAIAKILAPQGLRL